MNRLGFNEHYFFKNQFKSGVITNPNGITGFANGSVLAALVLCSDTALRLRAELEARNPSQMMPISHLIQQFVFTASQSVFTEAFCRAGLQDTTAISRQGMSQLGWLLLMSLCVRLRVICLPYNRISTPG